ncbi:MAG: ribosome maturation factor RimP [Firmicutes bacterium]|nr:ribosome maturation factor RimP [Bacillota bacterium]
MSGKLRVVDVVEKLINDFIKDKEFELVDVEFVKEGQYRYLRVYMDKDGGISLDDCKLVSNYLSEKLDSLDPIEENYFLEVSSPGIERPLKKDKDFIKYKGELIQVKLYRPLDGQKLYEGILEGIKNDEVIMKIDDEKVIKIPRDKIATAKLVFKFE